VPLERLKELGFRLISFPVSTLLAVTVSMREVLAKIKADGTSIQAMERLLPLGDFIDLIGLPEIREIEERLSDEKARLPR
jgi:2-methylisocitrate lyase-like PEP mutase family enzyme